MLPVLHLLERRRVGERHKHYHHGVLVSRLGSLGGNSALEELTTCTALSFCPDDERTLAIGDENSRLHLWRPSYSGGDVTKSFDTGHTGSVQCVRFLAGSRGAKLICCSTDRQVRLVDLNRQATRNFLCHRARVKALAGVSPDVFLSASEDGSVRLFDIRDASRGGGAAAAAPAGSESPCLLVEQRYERCASRGSSSALQRISIQALAVSPLAPHLFVTGGGDPFARMYDMRMLRGSGGAAQTAPGASPSSERPSWVSCFAPDRMCSPSLVAGSTAGFGSLGRVRHLTGLAFAAGGQHLLLSYSGDAIYSVCTRGHAMSCGELEAKLRRRAAAATPGSGNGGTGAMGPPAGRPVNRAGPGRPGDRLQALAWTVHNQANRRAPARVTPGGAGGAAAGRERGRMRGATGVPGGEGQRQDEDESDDDSLPPQISSSNPSSNDEQQQPPRPGGQGAAGRGGRAAVMSPGGDLGASAAVVVLRTAGLGPGSGAAGAAQAEGSAWPQPLHLPHLRLRELGDVSAAGELGGGLPPALLHQPEPQRAAPGVDEVGVPDTGTARRQQLAGDGEEENGEEMLRTLLAVQLPAGTMTISAGTASVPSPDGTPPGLIGSGASRGPEPMVQAAGPGRQTQLLPPASLLPQAGGGPSRDAGGSGGRPGSARTVPTAEATGDGAPGGSGRSDSRGNTRRVAVLRYTLSPSGALRPSPSPHPVRTAQPPPAARPGQTPLSSVPPRPSLPVQPFLLHFGSDMPTHSAHNRIRIGGGAARGGATADSRGGSGGHRAGSGGSDGQGGGGDDVEMEDAGAVPEPLSVQSDSDRGSLQEPGPGLVPQQRQRPTRWRLQPREEEEEDLPAATAPERRFGGGSDSSESSGHDGAEAAAGEAADALAALLTGRAASQEQLHPGAASSQTPTVASAAVGPCDVAVCPEPGHRGSQGSDRGAGQQLPCGLPCSGKRRRTRDPASGGSGDELPGRRRGRGGRRGLAAPGAVSRELEGRLEAREAPASAHTPGLGPTVSGVGAAAAAGAATGSGNGETGAAASPRYGSPAAGAAAAAAAAIRSGRSQVLRQRRTVEPPATTGDGVVPWPPSPMTSSDDDRMLPPPMPTRPPLAPEPASQLRSSTPLGEESRGAAGSPHGGPLHPESSEPRSPHAIASDTHASARGVRALIAPPASGSPGAGDATDGANGGDSEAVRRLGGIVTAEAGGRSGVSEAVRDSSPVAGSAEEAGGYVRCFDGHKNVMTVKEVVWMGGSSFGPSYVASGSDDGHVFIWDYSTGEIVRMLPLREQVIPMALAVHPDEPLLASCGMGSVIKVWAPGGGLPGPISCRAASHFRTRRRPDRGPVAAPLPGPDPEEERMEEDGEAREEEVEEGEGEASRRGPLTAGERAVVAANLEDLRRRRAEAEAESAAGDRGGRPVGAGWATFAAAIRDRSNDAGATTALFGATLNTARAAAAPEAIDPGTPRTQVTTPTAAAAAAAAANSPWGRLLHRTPVGSPGAAVPRWATLRAMGGGDRAEGHGGEPVLGANGTPQRLRRWQPAPGGGLGPGAGQEGEGGGEEEVPRGRMLRLTTALERQRQRSGSPEETIPAFGITPPVGGGFGGGGGYAVRTGEHGSAETGRGLRGGLRRGAAAEGGAGMESDESGGEGGGEWDAAASPRLCAVM